MKYILAVDLGGSKTTTMLLDYEGNIVGVGNAKGANPNVKGIDMTCKYLSESITYACGENIDPKDITHLFGGIAGAEMPDEVENIVSNFKNITNIENVQIFNDVTIALHSGIPQNYGVCLCIGTGANCISLDKEGNYHLIGRYMQAESQGGYAIAKMGIKLALRMGLGLEEKTNYFETILEAFNVKDTDELTIRIEDDDFLDISHKKIVPLVLKQADNGDPLCVSKITDFGKHLSEFVIVSIKKAKLEDAPHIVLTGGILKGTKLLHDVISAQIKSIYPSAVIIQPAYEPIVGAALLAFKSLGLEQYEENIKISASKNGLLRVFTI